MSTRKSWRGVAPIRAMLVAALVAASGIGAYDYVGAQTSGDSASASDSIFPGNDSSDSSTQPVEEIAPFTTADVGACLTWDFKKDGSVENFEQASCDKEHRFEISAREDLGTYPTSEFGPEAQIPDLKRQAQLREELCQAATLTYLDGKFDPSGKYTIAPILPPAEAWAKGDRTMLCGLQSNDEEGIPQITKGKVKDNDQSALAQPGDCRAIDDSQILRTVDCSRKHQLETISVVNLTEHFSKGVPSEDKQDAYLAKQCTDAAIKYVGSEEKLYQTTLQPFWGTVEESSWRAGSRSVNCSLIHANKKGGFSVLTGTAKDGRTGITVDGETPKKQPKRNPLRKDRESVAPDANPELPVAGAEGNVDTGGSNLTPAEPQQQYQDPNQGYQAPQQQQQYQDPNQGYQDPNQQAVDPNQQAIDPNTGLAY